MLCTPSTVKLSFSNELAKQKVTLREVRSSRSDGAAFTALCFFYTGLRQSLEPKWLRTFADHLLVLALLRGLFGGINPLPTVMEFTVKNWDRKTHTQTYELNVYTG